MLMWLFWTVVIMLVLFAFFVLVFRRAKLFLFLLLLFFAGTLIAYNLISKNNINSVEIISSFFSETDPVLAAAAEELPTALPGNSWRISHSDLTNIRQGINSFKLIPREESLWWDNTRGTIVYRISSGDFLFSSMVKTRKSSDTLRFPDKGLQFGGIMLRNPTADNTEENYISISVGFRDDKLQIETKSTTKGETTASGFPWPSGDAELMIQSESGVYGLYARPYATKGEWTRFQTYYRPDLPKDIHAGLIAYSYGSNKQDLTVYFDDILLRRQNGE